MPPSRNPQGAGVKPRRIKPAVAPGQQVETLLPPDSTAPKRTFSWKDGVKWGLPTVALLIFIVSLVSLIQRAGDSSIPIISFSFPTWRGGPAATRDPATLVVVLDAGHGGKDIGAQSHGLVEKDLALDLALRVEKRLRSAGIAVEMTRRDDRYLPLGARTGIANEIPNAIFVSLHFNHTANQSASGVEVFYAASKESQSEGWTLAGLGGPQPILHDDSPFLAESVQKTLVSRTGSIDRGAKPRQLYVVRNAQCPAILVEGGFLTNGTEASRLKENTWRETLAGAVAEGIQEYLKKRKERNGTGPV